MVEPLLPDILDARRAPRLPLRLAVELRHHRASWWTETEDVGPRGCQVATQHELPAGREVALAIGCPALGRAVAASGRVTWSRAEAPARLGIAFDVAPADRGWFAELLRGDPAASRAASHAPLRLRRDEALYLGEPPALVLDFSADELAVLRVIGAGTTVGAVAEALGGRFHRARGALFSLVARRLVLLRAGRPDAPERWRAILSPWGARKGPLEPPPRPPEAQRLYEEGVAFLGAGRVDLAVARFRAALGLVPGDASIAGTLERLERWR